MIATYIACLVFGLVVAVVSAAAGGHGDGGGADHGGADHAGGDHGSHHGADAAGFPYFSPAVLGSFLAAFGAGGLVAVQVFGVTSLAVHLGMALGSGVGLAALAGLIMMRVVRAAESSTLVREHELVDAEGDVVTEIPGQGIGEVAVLAGSTRMTFPARSESGDTIARRALVVVTRVVGGTLYVREHIEERLRRLGTPGENP